MSHAGNSHPGEAPTGHGSVPVIRTFRMAATVAGDDVPTFLLLHGIGLSHRFFTRLARILSDTGDVVSFDLPGFGASPKPDQQLRVEDYAELIGQHRATSRSGPVVVVGHSMGAQFAIELAVQNPELVSHVVLVGPVVDPARPTLRAQFLTLARDAPLEPLRTQVAVLYDYIRCGIPWFVTEAVAMRDYPSHLRIHGVTQPLLVIRGQHDPIAKPTWAKWLSDQNVSGELVTIAGKRHNVPHSGPTETATAITTFIGRGPELGERRPTDVRRSRAARARKVPNQGSG